jgi:hypothetical protein
MNPDWVLFESSAKAGLAERNRREECAKETDETYVELPPRMPKKKDWS